MYHVLYIHACTFFFCVQFSVQARLVGLMKWPCNCFTRGTGTAPSSGGGGGSAGASSRDKPSPGVWESIQGGLQVGMLAVLADAHC